MLVQVITDFDFISPMTNEKQATMEEKHTRVAASHKSVMPPGRKQNMMGKKVWTKVREVAKNY